MLTRRKAAASNTNVVSDHFGIDATGLSENQQAMLVFQKAGAMMLQSEKALHQLTRTSRKLLPDSQGMIRAEDVVAEITQLQQSLEQQATLTRDLATVVEQMSKENHMVNTSLIRMPERQTFL